MVFTFDTNVEGAKYTIIAPENKEEDAQIVRNGIPSDIWVHIEGSKYLPTYIRQPFSAINSSALDIDEIPPAAIKAASQIAKYQANSKRDANINYTFMSNITLNGPLDSELVRKTVSKTKKTGDIADPQLVATKNKRVVDFEAERIEHDKELRKQSSVQFRRQQKTERESSRQFKQLAEQKHRGYTDLYLDEEAIQQSSNQNRTEDWEDDFM